MTSFPELLGAPERWTQDALCAQTNPDVFFPETPADAWAARDAKRICAACDVVAECLEYALRTGQTHGVWGGKSPSQRARMAKETKP